MAYKIDPAVRVFTVDTGRLPKETHDLIAELREKYPGLNLDVLEPDAGQVERLVSRRVRPDEGFGREPAPLLQRPQGAAADEASGRPRRVGHRAAPRPVGDRTNIRKVEIDHDHGAIVKLNPLAEWTKREVWEYLRENDVPVHALYAKGYTSIGCAPCTRPIADGEDDRAGRWWWETNAPKECGMHCSIEHGGFEHELKAILGTMPLIAVRGDAAEVALGEAQAVLSHVHDPERRGRLADLSPRCRTASSATTTRRRSRS